MDLTDWLLGSCQAGSTVLTDATGELAGRDLAQAVERHQQELVGDGQRGELSLVGYPDRAFVIDYLAALRSGRAVKIGQRGSVPPPPSTLERSARTGSAPCAVTMFTSGSTAEPTAVPLTAENLISNGTGIIEALGICDSDRVLCALPFAYSFGLSLLHTALAAGACAVLPGHLTSAPDLLAAVNDYEATVLGTVPTIARRMVRRLDTLAGLGSLRMIQIAGGSLDVASTAALAEALAGRASLQIMYGLTEATARVTAFDATRHPEKIGSCGRPISGVTVHCEGPNGDKLDVGRPGTIVVSGPGVCQQLAREDGRLATGDHGHIDADGFVWVTGRTGDFAKVGDVRVSLGDIERFLLTHSEVDEAVAVAVADSVQSERIVVLVTTSDPSVDVARLQASARASMPSVLFPSRVHLVEQIPTLPNGKVDRLAAAALAESLETRHATAPVDREGKSA